MFRFFLLLCGLAVASPAWSQTSVSADRATGLRLQDAVRLTLDRNPKLQGHRFAIAASQARRDQAALRPAVEISIDAENILGTGRLSAFDDAEITLRLGTVLERGDKRARRIAVAEQERGLILTTQDAERLDLLADVARHFIGLLEAQETARLAHAATSLATRTRDIVRLRANAGRASPVEEHNSDLALARTEMEDQRAAIDMNARWAVLAAAWAGAPDQRETAAGDLFALPHPADYTAAAAMVDRNPDILRFASERRLQDSALRLAEAARTADITVSAGIRRLQADRAQAAVLSVSMPLGAAGRNRPAEDELRSRLSGLQFEESNRRSDVLAALYAAYQHLNEGRARLEGIRSRALPLAEAAVKAAENAFRVGRFSLLELNLAQQQSLDLQRDAIVTAAANHLLVLEIDRLIGAPVPEMEISP